VLHAGEQHEASETDKKGQTHQLILCQFFLLPLIRQMSLDSVHLRLSAADSTALTGNLHGTVQGTDRQFPTRHGPCRRSRACISGLLANQGLHPWLFHSAPPGFQNSDPNELKALGFLPFLENEVSYYSLSKNNKIA
jgi:hypothetical protein